MYVRTEPQAPNKGTKVPGFIRPTQKQYAAQIAAWKAVRS